jgi:hypothetical protein
MVFFMVKTKPKTVEEVFSTKDEAVRQIALKLRNLVKSAVPQAVEIVRRGRITYTIEGKDFAAIRFTRRHVDLLFLHGTSISSTCLKGQGTIGDPKHMQIVNLKNFNDAEAKRLLVEEAATVTALA